MTGSGPDLEPQTEAYRKTGKSFGNYTVKHYTSRLNGWQTGQASINLKSYASCGQPIGAKNGCTVAVIQHNTSIQNELCWEFEEIDVFQRIAMT